MQHSNLECLSSSIYSPAVYQLASSDILVSSPALHKVVMFYSATLVMYSIPILVSQEYFLKQTDLTQVDDSDICRFDSGRVHLVGLQGERD